VMAQNVTSWYSKNDKVAARLVSMRRVMSCFGLLALLVLIAATGYAHSDPGSKHQRFSESWWTKAMGR
jgi:hypothetical protein